MTAHYDDNRSGRNHTVGANSRTAVQQRQSKRAGTRACQKSGPTVLPSLTGPTSQNTRHRPGLGLCQLAHERTGFLRPAPTNLGSEDHQASSSVAIKFGISALLAATGLSKCRAIHVCALTARQPICSDGRHERGVDHRTEANHQQPPRGGARPARPQRGPNHGRRRSWRRGRRPHGKPEQLRSPLTTTSKNTCPHTR